MVFKITTTMMTNKCIWSMNGLMEPKIKNNLLKNKYVGTYV